MSDSGNDEETESVDEDADPNAPDGALDVWLQRWHVLISGPKDDQYCDGICGSWRRGKMFKPDRVVRTDSGVYGPALGGRAELIAIAPCMLRTILFAEWTSLERSIDPKSVPLCPMCHGERPSSPDRGHKSGCHIDMILSLCGLSDQLSRSEARHAIRVAGLAFSGSR